MTMKGNDSMDASPAGNNEKVSPQFMRSRLKLILLASFVGQALYFADCFTFFSVGSLRAQTTTTTTKRRGAVAPPHATEKGMDGREAGTDIDNDADNYVEMRYRRLRFNWTQLNAMSPLARLWGAHQNNCSLSVARFMLRNRYGLGSGLHLWTQALCNAVQNNVRLQTNTDLPWIFRDEVACSALSPPPPPRKTIAPHDDALIPTIPHLVTDCYFPHVEPRCSNDDEEIKKTSNVSKKLLGIGMMPYRKGCLAFQERMDASTSDIRAAGVEFLFSGVSSVVVDEAHRQLNALFNSDGGSGPPPTGDRTSSTTTTTTTSNSNDYPAVLVTVHIRWGDKIAEVANRPMSEYVDAVHALLKLRNVSDPTTVGIFLASEDPSAVEQFQVEAEKNHWRVFVDMYYQEFSAARDGGYNGNPKMAEKMRGRPGLVALASLLVALQADDYVLTTTSNWSRLMNELRKNVLDPRCNNCTRMIDLFPDPREW